MNALFAMLNTPEVIALLALALIIFGAKKLPELAKGLGQGIREFKKSSREITDEIHSAVDVDAPAPAPRRIVEPAPVSPPPSVPAPAQTVPSTVDHKA